MQNKKDYEDLQKLIKITIKFNNKSYEQVMKRRYD